MTKAKTKGEKLRVKKKRSVMPEVAGPPKKQPNGRKRRGTTRESRAAVERPTPERMAKGDFIQTRYGPAFDREHDYIAKLFQAAVLNEQERDAFRAYEALRARWLAEIGASRPRDCLTLTEPKGYVGGNGDAALCARIARIHAVIYCVGVGHDVDKLVNNELVPPDRARRAAKALALAMQEA